MKRIIILNLEFIALIDWVYGHSMKWLYNSE
jgi:hypothetical protein